MDGQVDHPSPYRIKIDIFQSIQNMALLQYAAVETVLPKMSSPPPPAIESLGIFAMSPLDPARKFTLRLGPRNEMNMIRHQAEAGNGDVALFGVVLEEIQVKKTVFGSEIDRLTVITLLRDMVV